MLLLAAWAIVKIFLMLAGAVAAACVFVAIQEQLRDEPLDLLDDPSEYSRQRG